MNIQVNTDNHIQLTEPLTRQVEETITATLGRFSGQVTRFEVHLQDVNAGKAGAQDKRCLIEARLEGRPPATASDEAESIGLAISGAARKLQRVLESDLGKLRHGGT